ncbi:MAG: periplasmic heavy metal sensor [bacterium]
MKDKILLIVLGFSLGLNLSLGGYELYGWVKERNAQEQGPALHPVQPGSGLPPPLQRKLERERRPWIPEFQRMFREMRAARQDLYAALREQPPDPGKVRASLDRVAAVQKAHQSMVVERIMRESESMDPDERRAYLDWIGRALHGPGMGPGCGPGKGRRRPEGPAGAAQAPGASPPQHEQPGEPAPAGPAGPALPGE